MMCASIQNTLSNLLPMKYGFQGSHIVWITTNRNGFKSKKIDFKINLFQGIFFNFLAKK